MEVVTALIGGLPRPVGLAKAIEKYNTGKLSQEKLEQEYRKHTVKAYEKLKEIGISIVTDPLYRWDDIFNPLIGFIEGIEVNGLYKFYENNFFYRSPVVKEQLSLRDNPIIEWTETNREILEDVYPDATLKQVLPGPVSLAFHSLDEYYNDRTALARDYGRKVLLPLIRKLKNIVDIIELHEPALCIDDKSEYLGILNEIVEKSPLKAWIVTYFGEPKVDGIEKLNAVINVDLVESKGEILEKLNGEVGIGIVNSRETRLEDVKRLREILSSLSNRFSTIYITPNTLLDFLPESVAFRKLQLLKKLVGGG